MSNKAFGIMKTGIDSLDRLFTSGDATDGAIRYARNEGFFGVVMGTAGTGKSVLSIQLCCRFASPDSTRKAVYLSQESFETVQGRMTAMFGFVPQRDADCITNDEVALLKPGGRARIAVVQLSIDPENQRKKIDYLLGFLGRKGSSAAPEDLLVCFDSAETIHPEAMAHLLGRQSTPPDKDYYRDLRRCCQQHHLNTWWVFEEERAAGGGENSTASIAATPQAYAADVVIRLSAREVADTTYRERDLEIIKARHQACRRGRHSFSIYSLFDAPKTDAGKRVAPAGSGIEIWQSVATRLSRIHASDRGRSGRNAVAATGTSHTKITAHRLGIDEVDAAVTRLQKNTSDGYLDPGSTSVLVSDLDSLASEIGLHFAVLGGQARAAGQDYVILSLASDPETLGKTAHAYTALRSASVVDRIHYFGPDYVSDGKLLHDIDLAIGGASRIVVDNIFALGSRYPLLKDPKKFIAALFRLLKSKPAASLVIDLVEVGEGRNPLSESFAAGLADNVFLLRHVEFQSQLRKILHVLKLAAHVEPPDFWELCQENNRIHAVDRLDFYKGVLSGRPEQLEVNLSLYAEAEGSPLDLHLRTQGGVMSQTFGQTVKVNICHHSAYAGLQNSLATGELRALGDCHVISIDEIWLKDLISNEALAPFHWEHFLPKMAGPSQDHGGSYTQWVTAAYDIAIRALLQKKSREDGGVDLNDIKQRYCTKTIVAVPDRNNVGVLAYNPNVWSCVIDPKDKAKVRVSDLDELRAWAKRVAQKKARANPADIPWQDDPRDPKNPDDDRDGVAVSWSDLAALQKIYLNYCTTKLQLDQLWMEPSTYREWEDWRQPRKPDETNMRRFDPGRDLWATRRETRADSEFVASMPRWGVFTCSMNQRESCVCFYIELLLGLLPRSQFPISNDGTLNWELPVPGRPGGSATSAWEAALELLLRLLSPWDILRLAHCWYRSTNDERPCLFSRQWFSSWGALGLREPGLAIKELPVGAAGVPTPVSGVWYLGIIKGSTAVRAGAKLIQHLASERTELFKLNRGIGLPVRARLFGDPKSPRQPTEVRVPLPYRKQFLKLKKAHNEHGIPSRNEDNWCPKDVLESRCPFYRSLIDDYEHVSQLIMGMIVSAAREALRPENRTWLWSREALPSSIGRELKTIVGDARKRYRYLERERRSHA